MRKRGKGREHEQRRRDSGGHRPMFSVEQSKLEQPASSGKEMLWPTLLLLIINCTKRKPTVCSILFLCNSLCFPSLSFQLRYCLCKQMSNSIQQRYGSSATERSQTKENRARGVAELKDRDFDAFHLEANKMYPQQTHTIPSAINMHHYRYADGWVLGKFQASSSQPLLHTVNT